MPHRPSPILVCALALVAWSGSILRAGFSFDDREAIEANPVVEGGLPWSAAFQRDYWEHVGAAGHYRPLATLALRLDHGLYGDRAFGFHLTNILLHLLAVWLACLVWRRLAEPVAWPWFGICVFAAHPVLADSVAWISGRSSMLVLASGLAATWAIAALAPPGRRLLASKHWGVAACAFAGVLLALCSKEDGVVWVLALPLVALRHSRKLGAQAAVGAVLGLTLAAALRAAALGSPWPSAPHAPLAGHGLLTRLTVAGRAMVEGLRLLAWPASYPPHYRAAAFLDPGQGASGVTVLGVFGWAWLAALVLAGGLAIRRRRASTTGWSAWLVACALLPVLQIVPAGEVFAPRFLYLPLALSAPLVHAGWARAFRGSRAGLVCAGLVCALMIAGAWSRSSVYADRASYARAVLAHHPRDARSLNDLGVALLEAQRPEAARRAWQRAASLDPDYGRAWSNLGAQQMREGRHAAALAPLRRAVALGAGNPVAHCNLGNCLRLLGRNEEAREVFARATEIAPGMTAAWRGLGRACLALERPAAARAALDRALALDPADARTAALLRKLDSPRR
jgi:tetratricopeptide (TPR) repeat protein